MGYFITPDTAVLGLPPLGVPLEALIGTSNVHAPDGRSEIFLCQKSALVNNANWIGGVIKRGIA